MVIDWKNNVPVLIVELKSVNKIEKEDADDICDLSTANMFLYPQQRFVEFDFANGSIAHQDVLILKKLIKKGIRFFDLAKAGKA